MKLLKKIFPYLILLYLASQFFISLFDISIRHIDPIANPDYRATEYKNRTPVYLVSYAAGSEVFYQNQHALVQSALNRGVDFYHNYRPSLLDNDFYEQNKSVLNEKVGAGYWLWKPYVILKALQNMPENAVLVYADTGLIFTSSLMPVIEKTEKYDGIFYFYEPEIFSSLSASTDTQVASETGVDNMPEYKNFPQLWAGFMVFKNTQTSREFVKKWLDMCLNTNWLKGYGQGRHQHDQSLMGICFLQNQKGMHGVDAKEFRNILKWHHRHKNESDYGLLVYQKPGMHYFEHKAWRFPPLKWLRYTLVKGWY
jgi:hypothetical protein